MPALTRYRLPPNRRRNQGRDSKTCTGADNRSWRIGDRSSRMDNSELMRADIECRISQGCEIIDDLQSLQAKLFAQAGN